MGGLKSASAILDDDTFTEKDQVLIELASRGAKQSEMAEHLGLTVRQIQRKLQIPKIRAAVRQFCRNLFELRMRGVQSHWDKMEDCFVSILDDGDANVYAKIAAATQIKGMCFQARELDVEDELDELRGKIAAIESAIQIGSGAGGSPRLLANDQDDE